MRDGTGHEGEPREAAGLGQALLLGFILLFALAVRLVYLWPSLGDPEHRWLDPDHYLMGARLLTRDGWDWTFRAVRYEWAGRDFYLPPLYPAFLSLFSVFSNMAGAAQLGQLLLGVAAVGLVYEMGRLVHSVRAGLAAAAIYALWFPNVIATWFYQETLYVPLVLLAFVLYLRARRPAGFAVAGGAFGLAALTRSMPLYFVPFLVAVHLFRTRGEGGRAALALVLGFGAAVAPYSAALSTHVGEFTAIENHGGILLLVHDMDSEESAGTLSTAESLVRAAGRRGLAAFALDAYGSVRSVLQVNGGRLLQSHVTAESWTSALLYKVGAHLFGDVPFVAGALFTPFGLALAKRRDASALAALWIGLNLLLVALGGFAGPRLRAPFEPQLVVYGSVAALEGFRRLGALAWGLSGALSLATALVLVPQLPRSLDGWPDYGIRWQHRPRGWRTLVRGSAGFNVLSRTGTIRLELRGRGSFDTQWEVRIARQTIASVTLAPQETFPIEHPFTKGTLAYVEVRAPSPSSEEPREVLVVTRRPR